MDMVRHMGIHPRLSEEGQKERPEHIEGGHPRGYGSHQPEQEMAPSAGEGHPENLILAEESREARHARDRQRGDEEGPKGDGNLLSQCAHLPDIELSAQGVHHTSRAETKKPLEKV